LEYLSESSIFAFQRKVRDMKSTIFKTLARHKWHILLPLLAIAIGAWALWRLLPASKNGMRHSTCLIDGEQALKLTIDSTSIILKRDSIHQQGTWVNRFWWLPSCLGRIVTVAPPVHLFHDKPWPKDHKALMSLLKSETDSLAKLYHYKVIEGKELAYYLRTHGVQDEGYNLIVSYSYRQKAETDSLGKLLKVLKAIKPKSSVSLVCSRTYKAWWVDRFKKYHEAECLSSESAQPQTSGLLMLQTKDHLTPLGVNPMSRYPWITMRNRKLFCVTLVRKPKEKNYDALIVEGHAQYEKHDLPQLFAPQGAPVFTVRGCYAGTVDQREIKK
jgi:hypothetical protein